MLFENFPLLDKRRLYLPSLSDVAAVVKDFTVTEMTTLVSVVLWLVVMAMPLTGIDRRDNITGITYLLYAAGSGIMLTVVIPGKFVHWDDAIWQIASLLGLLAVASIRWIKRPPPPIVKASSIRETETKA